MQIIETISNAVNNPAINGKTNASIWALTITGVILKDIQFNDLLTAISLISASAASLTTVIVQLKNLFNNKNNHFKK